ncbi:uncharacterized protein NPIL_558261 [Nephila pilipes]|uniref:Uncharacterized protein n=1 Tax=Nephila pilipes TaxID=299642 RepID=A0A8X6R2H6_NEPPI|nr:uncharacterized protein NPIL_558261 [Nephila pilipes]
MKTFEDNLSKNRLVYIWGGLSSVMYASILICSIYLVVDSVEISDYMFGYSFEEPNYNVVIGILYVIDIVVFHMLPINIFSVFYVLVCHYLRRHLQKFKDNISWTNPENLLDTYTCIKLTIANIDDELSFLVFITMILNSTFMYVSISMAFGDWSYGILTQSIQNWLLFATTFGSVVAISVSASLICDISHKIGTEAEFSFRNNLGSRYMQLRFLMSAEKEIYMTAWKMLPIKGNFLLGTTTAIFSYVILFRDL